MCLEASLSWRQSGVCNISRVVGINSSQILHRSRVVGLLVDMMF